ncbi:hypothetical protein [Tumebacillus lipolyticus]|uniref:Uncharacterized protein n=1 Tax=Tumebacillus lipolyticus TaxID=1280370 RepID=A0ABW4ZXN8_9BACL
MKYHQTVNHQHDPLDPPHEVWVDEQLLPLQRIEGGGPPKKVILSQMPKWLRMFFLFVMGSFLLMGAFGVYMTFFRS